MDNPNAEPQEIEIPEQHRLVCGFCEFVWDRRKTKPLVKPDGAFEWIRVCPNCGMHQTPREPRTCPHCGELVP